MYPTRKILREAKAKPNKKIKQGRRASDRPCRRPHRAPPPPPSPPRARDRPLSICARRIQPGLTTALALGSLPPPPPSLLAPSIRFGWDLAGTGCLIELSVWILLSLVGLGCWCSCPEGGGHGFGVGQRGAGRDRRTDRRYPPSIAVSSNNSTCCDFGCL